MDRLDPTRRQIVNQNWRKVVKANDLDERFKLIGLGIV